MLLVKNELAAFLETLGPPHLPSLDQGQSWPLQDFKGLKSQAFKGLKSKTEVFSNPLSIAFTIKPQIIKVLPLQKTLIHLKDKIAL